LLDLKKGGEFLWPNYVLKNIKIKFNNFSLLNSTKRDGNIISEKKLKKKSEKILTGILEPLFLKFDKFLTIVLFIKF